MILGKRKDTGEWQVIHRHDTMLPRPEGAWSTVLVVTDINIVNEYQVEPVKWSLVDKP